MGRLDRLRRRRLVVNGAVTIIEGLAGIFHDETYFGPGELLVFDYKTWGWIHLVIGVCLLIVGTMLLGFGSFACSPASSPSCSSCLDLVAQFTWINATRGGASS